MQQAWGYFASKMSCHAIIVLLFWGHTLKTAVKYARMTNDDASTAMPPKDSDPSVLLCLPLYAGIAGVTELSTLKRASAIFT